MVLMLCVCIYICDVLYDFFFVRNQKMIIKKKQKTKNKNKNKNKKKREFSAMNKDKKLLDLLVGLPA